MSLPISDINEYILKGYLNWIANNENLKCAHVVCFVDKVAASPSIVKYSSNGTIVFSLDPAAIRDLIIDKHGVSFSARFHRVETNVFLPYDAIDAMVAYDMDGFERMPLTISLLPDTGHVEQPDTKPTKDKSGKSFLRVVK